ncbi:MAG TPA: diacylglycerol kinase family lipid kinase [Chloroflexi bacterium]|nr:diacylglycerol kinase family lipid kinase [Chloroflexota bacterium]
MRTHIIINPSANRGQARTLAADLDSRALLPPGSTRTFTSAPGEAVVLARQAAAEGCEMVVAAGGDGTVHEVVNGLMQVPAKSRPRLGILPIGSGNDFAYALGIPPQPDAAAEVLRQGVPQRVDIGMAQDEHGKVEYWDNTLGIGFDAAVNVRSRRINLANGYLIYLLAALQTVIYEHRPLRFRFQGPDETWEKELLMLSFCNGPREGGAFRLVPQADPCDGVLDYAHLSPVPRWRTVRALFMAMQGTHTGLPEIHLGQTTQAVVEGNLPFKVHMDGEIYLGDESASRRLEITLLPAALRVQVPGE